VAAYGESHLPEILSRSGKLKASHAKDGEAIQLGRIYIAPPNFHLLLDDEKVVVKKGPKENRFRPSIDALFRSAAYTYGARVISIVLSGMLDDGTSGMWTVKRMGGITIIQDPHEAVCPSMPHNVMEYVDVDYSVPVNEMGNILQQLIGEEVNHIPQLPADEFMRLKTEVAIASENTSCEMGIINMGHPSALTCPECSGALTMMKDGKLTRYRCHTGHAYTSNSLLENASKTTEDNMWKAVKSIEEVMMLLKRSEAEFIEAGKENKAAECHSKVEIIKQKSEELRKMIFSMNILNDDNITDTAEATAN
jgi:two-component system, chemotaxis family, protein-glutamate methylesterase/glutaminase